LRLKSLGSHRALIGILLSSVSLIGCGGGSSKNNPSVVVSPVIACSSLPAPSSSGAILGTQMGGARQTPLTLSNTVSTMVGSPGNMGLTDGAGSISRLKGPYGVATDGISLYVADGQSNTIRRVSLATGTVCTFAGTASAAGGSADGVGVAASFYLPSGITTDGTNLYVADSGNNTIRKIVIASGVVSTLAGTAGINSAGGADGTGVVAQFHTPHGITTDGTNLYVADAANNTIRKIVISSGVVTTLAGVASFGAGCNHIDGTGTGAQFATPSGITTDGTNLYVTERCSHTVSKIVISTGQSTTIAGMPGLWGYIDGAGASAQFNFPSGITTDGSSLYIADESNDAIRKIDIATQMVSTVAGLALANTSFSSGSTGYAGSTDGIGTAARFSLPREITSDGLSLYVTDRGNHTIRKIQ